MKMSLSYLRTVISLLAIAPLQAIGKSYLVCVRHELLVAKCTREWPHYVIVKD